MIISQSKKEGEKHVFGMPHGKVSGHETCDTHIKEARHYIGNNDANESFLDKGPILQGLFQGMGIKKSVAGDKKEGGHAVAAQHFTQKVEPVPWCTGLHDKVTDVDGNDPQHGKGAQMVKDNVSFFHKRAPLNGVSLTYQL